METVDALLADALALLGDGEPPVLISPAEPSEVDGDHGRGWEGDAAGVAGATAVGLSERRRRLRTVHAAVGEVLQRAGTISRDARSAMHAVQAQWQEDKSVLQPWADTPMGRSALLAAAQARIGEAVKIVTSAGAAFAEAGAQVQTLSTGLPMPESPVDESDADGLGGDEGGQQSGPPRTGAEISRVLEQLPVGNRNPGVRVVSGPRELQDLWEWSQHGGVEMVPSPYGDARKGPMVKLPDGTTVGRRPTSGSDGGPVLDFNIPGEGYTKVHCDPRSGGIPELPHPLPEQAPQGPGWGTFVSPEEAAGAGGVLGNLGKLLESQAEPHPNDPETGA